MGWGRGKLLGWAVWEAVTDGLLWRGGSNWKDCSFDLRQLADGFPPHFNLAFQLLEELMGPLSAPRVPAPLCAKSCASLCVHAGTVMARMVV